MWMLLACLFSRGFACWRVGIQPGVYLTCHDELAIVYGVQLRGDGSSVKVWMPFPRRGQARRRAVCLDTFSELVEVPLLPTDGAEGEGRSVYLPRFRRLSQE